MKVAIITASIGGIDEIKGIPKQTIPVDYYAYFDNNLPYPLPNLNNRLKSKYLKIQTHRFLPDYDYYIWIDGRVEITADVFAEEMVKAIGECSVGIFGHPERDFISQEYDFIKKSMASGNQYLVSRYSYQAIEKEIEWAVKSDLIQLPLYACNVFVRRNDKRTNEAFDEWWRRCIEFTNFDQCMFSCTVGFDCIVSELDRKDFKKQFTIGQHLK